MVSVSPQSRASLAAHYSLSSSEVARRLTSFLKNLGEFEFTFHMTSQRHSPVCIEIMQTGLSGVHYVFDTGFSRSFSLLESQREFLERFRRKEVDKKALPMLASACPGRCNLFFLLCAKFSVLCFLMGPIWIYCC